MTDDSIETSARDNSAPLISVVLPVYNGEKYLAEAIDSILAQTFTDYELIMIDDGSTDSSLQILQKYKQLDSRIRLVARENRGLVTTLNDLIDIARGEWVARMDQDDIALPNRFERQMKWLKETGADIAGSWVRRFGSSDKRLIRLRQTDDAIKMEMLFCSPFAHPSVVMRTSLVKQLRYDKAWEKAEDYDLWERAAEAGWKMTNVPEELLLYRQHRMQISTITLMQQQQQTLKIQRRYWRFVFERMQLEQQWIDEVLKIRGSAAQLPNMDAVDAALAVLLLRNHGEARDAILSHAMRLYFRIAADAPDAASRWDKLNRQVGERPDFSTWLKLWVLHNLGIGPAGKVFALLKKLHILLIRRT